MSHLTSSAGRLFVGGGASTLNSDSITQGVQQIVTGEQSLTNLNVAGTAQVGTSLTTPVVRTTDLSASIIKTTLVKQRDGGTEVKMEFDDADAETPAPSHVRLSTGALETRGTLRPAFTDVHDVGTISKKYKDAHFSGTVYANTLSVDSQTLVDVVATGDTESVSTTTGSLRTAGGAGIVKNLNVGGHIACYNTTESTGFSTGSITTDGGMGVAKDVYIKGHARVEASQESSSVTQGALTVTGGVGIGKKVHIGGVLQVMDETQTNSSTEGSILTAGGIGAVKNITSGGVVRALSTNETTSVTSGSLLTSGGLGVQKSCFLGGVLNNTNTTDSSSTTTGALITAGGLGVAKNVHVGATCRVDQLAMNTGRGSALFNIYATNTSYNQPMMYLHCARAGNAAYKFLECVGGSSGTSAYIRGDGQIGYYSLQSLSDESTKQNMVPLSTSVVQQLMLLEPLEYEWKTTFRPNDQVEEDGPEEEEEVPAPVATSSSKKKQKAVAMQKVKKVKRKRKHYGFTAQTVQKVFPDLVDKWDKDKLSVSYIEFVPILIAAVQELTREVDVLKKKSKA
jgi:hypothetical protein